MNLEDALAETNFLKRELDNCKYMYTTLERSRDYYQKKFIDAQKETNAGLFKVQEEQLNNVREERDQYKGLLIRLYNDLFVHHKGEAVRDFKALFREENYN